MYTEWQKELDALRSNLLNSITQAKERSRIGKDSEVRASGIRKQLAETQNARDVLNDTLNYMSRMYKNIEHYTLQKREESLELLKGAIEQAGMLVPAASSDGVKLVTKDKRARIVDNYGVDINLGEGSAYRSVLGVILRHTLLTFDPDALHLIILDEAFNTLSEDTIVALREVLPILAEDTLIIGIEQRNYVYEGLERTRYVAVKGDDDISVIRKLED